MNRLKLMGGGVGASVLCATDHGWGATLMSVLCATDHGGGSI